MSKGPEANFWSMIRKNLPNKCFATRIENKHGGGVPDVHIIWDHLPIWLELKTVKNNAVKISPHQIAWHMAYFARGGASYFLVKHLSSRHLYLFEGRSGPSLMEHGIASQDAKRFDDLDAMFNALRPHAASILSPKPDALRPLAPRPPDLRPTV